MHARTPTNRTVRAMSLGDQRQMSEAAKLFGSISSPTWRRQRLLSIGLANERFASRVDNTMHMDSQTTNETANETSILTDSSNLSASYGSIASNASRSHSDTSMSFRRLPSLPDISAFSTRLSPFSKSPTATAFITQIPQKSSYFRKPLSAYDGLAHTTKQTEDVFADSKLNGIRVWYSSFTSIDWLHDAIKESSRLWRLRRRRNLRGRIRSAMDSSVDWITITCVGFLVAVIAWLITRSEQWLFDLKEGHCSSSWWMAKRFCSEDHWHSWSETFDSRTNQEIAWIHLGIRTWYFQYGVYTLVALILASMSCLLTIYLTASPSFVTHKESGVLGPEFDVGAWWQSPTSEQRRSVLYFAAGSGIPEIKTILSGFVIHGYLGGRTLFTKAVGLSLSVASGLTLGKEGPFVHIASCIGNIVSRYFPKYELNEGKRREILSASAAAGVAVAFGAPIGGVLFSLEEVSYYFPPKVMWQSFFCAMIAIMTLGFLDPFGTGKLVLFHVTYDKDWHSFELIFFILLGAFGGLYGALFSKLNYEWGRVRERTWLKKHPVFEVLLVTLITALLCFLNPYTRMGGTELVYNLFSECVSGDQDHKDLCPIDLTASVVVELIQTIGFALVVKGALAIITFGIKLPAGIFIPTLTVGACFGRIVGISIQYLHIKQPNLSIFKSCNDDMGCIVPGLYAMIGAAATLSGVTRTTVSLVVIMFELTDSLTYAVPIMLAVLTAKSIADSLQSKGIYDLVIDLLRLPYLDSKRQYIWGNLRLSDVTDRNVTVINLDEENSVRALRDKLQNVSARHADGGFPVLKRRQGGMRMVGYIGLNELEHGLAIVADEAEALCSFDIKRFIDPLTSVSSLIDTPVQPDPLDFTMYMDRAPLTVQTHSPLELVQQFFSKLGAKYVIVLDNDGFYEGVIDKKTWVAFLNGQLNEKF